jgi:hypothetical protein
MPKNKTVGIADVGAMTMAANKRKKLAQSGKPAKKKAWTGTNKNRTSTKLAKSGNITKAGRVKKQKAQAIKSAYKTSLAMKNWK